MTVLAARYELLDKVGEGGMSVVWRARDRELDREVAIKMLRSLVAPDPAQLRRFHREARALAALAHGHIVRIYDYISNDEQSFLVMEYVDGANLAQTTRGRLPLATGEVAAYMRPVAQALAYAHGRGVVHRDLTPSNILIERGSGRVVTTDFGLARIARSTGSLTATGVLLGTPEYWSPELALGRENGAAADLYALGCILFLLLSGRLPFEGEDRLAVGLRRAHDDAPSLHSFLPDAPAPVAALVDSLLSARPGTTAGCHPRGRRAWCARRRLNCVFTRGGRCVGAERADRRAGVRAADDPPFASVGDDRPGAAARGAAGVDATALVGAATRGHRSRRVDCGRRRRTRRRGRGAKSAPARAKRRVAARRRGTRTD